MFINFDRKEVVDGIFSNLVTNYMFGWCYFQWLQSFIKR